MEKREREKGERGREKRRRKEGVREEKRGREKNKDIPTQLRSRQMEIVEMGCSLFIIP